MGNIRMGKRNLGMGKKHKIFRWQNLWEYKVNKKGIVKAES